MTLTSVYDVLSSKLDALVAGSKHEQRVLNEKLGMATAQLTDMTNVLRSRLDGVVKGVDNQARLFNSKFDALIEGLENQTRLLTEKLDLVIAGSDRPSQRRVNELAAETRRDEPGPHERRSSPP